MALRIDDLHTLYVSQLKDAYNAESQLIELMPTLIELAHTRELRSALKSHLEETRSQRQRIQEVFEGLDYEAEGERCAAMAGLIEEAEELVGEHVKDDRAIDAAIICACQKIEHYEIATYGCLAAYAQRLGRSGDVKVLSAILEEERTADERLTMIAEETANAAAVVVTGASTGVKTVDN